MQTIQIKKLIPTPDNPRRKLHEMDPKIQEMVKSIKARGVLQPVLARPHPTKPGKYDMRAGARRLFAATLAGLDEIPAHIIEMSDDEAMDATVTENLQRDDLTPLEDANGVNMLFRSGRTAEQIAASLGKSITWVVRRARLSHLISDWQKIYDDTPDMTASHLELVARFPEDVQQSLADEVRNMNWMLEAGYFHRFKNWVGEQTLHLRSAAFDLEDDTLCPRAGACAACPKRSSVNPGLFDDDLDPDAIKANDLCLDAHCFKAKTASHINRKEEALRLKNPDLIRISSHYERVDGALNSLEYHKAKKSTPGAVPGLVVDGESAGKIMYVIPNDSRKATKQENPNVEQPHEERMQEKREGLKRRRMALILEELQKRIILKASVAVVDGQSPPSQSKMMALLVAFGTSSNRRGDVTAWDLLRKLDANDLNLSAWDMVKDVIASTLAVYTVGAIGDKQINAAKDAADLIGVQWSEIEEMAEKEIPEPKSWSKGA